MVHTSEIHTPEHRDREFYRITMNENVRYSTVYDAFTKLYCKLNDKETVEINLGYGMTFNLSRIAENEHKTQPWIIQWDILLNKTDKMHVIAQALTRTYKQLLKKRQREFHMQKQKQETVQNNQETFKDSNVIIEVYKDGVLVETTKDKRVLEAKNLPSGYSFRVLNLNIFLDEKY